MSYTPTVLLVEDDISTSALIKTYLQRSNVNVDAAYKGKDALDKLAGNAPPDILLLDLHLPDMDGLDILREVKQRKLQTEIIVMTTNASVKTAVESMQLGARDFLVKPFAKERLLTTFHNVAENLELRKLVSQYKQTLPQHTFSGFIGSSLPMQSVYRIIESAASSKATVFIVGESGTGKEVCAEAIHQHSPRADKPFIALNCGAIPKDLMESEIFGHVKGAFTGALNNRDGAATLADGGTLFLDEICEMDLELQPKLLRFLQTGSVQPVGSGQLQKVDVRIICATNRNPLEEVEAGRFREDLYYRLHVLPISLPPLRERGDDFLEIANVFLSQYSQEENKAFKAFDTDVIERLRAYHWPGNIRQLQNVIRNVVVLNNSESVTLDMLPAPLNTAAKHTVTQPLPTSSSASSVQSVGSSPVQPKVRKLEDMERDAIEQAIDFCDGNIPEAAVLLGISPATIYRKKSSWRSS
ncbi:sigma-54 dependent transcriptional regulator [Bowmanella sp. JS7-9]|uniref:Sigma-54-dependent transcriptional regulator n=1 Tax=Pseudobowmanella zhangzhouensis TaxID=1537679 RepID=A0ABW1XGB7_9ALTE|nr:sigma-54 dependent transcriptional regulator [Bowmanella sp. JS7-9]TBX24686.1 ATPase AAA [Bowmanella sp. JS7-9]